MSEIRPFQIAVPQSELDDLRDRLRRTRWTPEIPGQGWTRGVPADYLRGLATYWAESYDWRAAEAALNRLPQFVTEVDGQTIHFAHIESANPAATPLLISHDWPSSFALYLPVVEAMREHFHLVLVSNAGFGFSGHTPFQPIVSLAETLGTLLSPVLLMQTGRGEELHAALVAAA
ncbi:epoxide hydrolase N-terminal domain-containing protein, partial [Actinoplanes sp. NPDC051633]|uniref:epoxide hydrolase N-terminal domain-containing protein n=1 Tax=Actinoplanes sp. NPDC051633 TaxID=3155670 RepID=UPI0034190759